MSRAVAKKALAKPRCEIWDLHLEELDILHPEVCAIVFNLTCTRPGEDYKKLLAVAIAKLTTERRKKMLAHARKARKAIESGKPAVRLAAIHGDLF